MHDSGRKSVIEKWMLTIVQDGGVERYDDLHVDVIDSDWKPKEAWVHAGLIAFQLAVELRNRHQLDFTVALGFSLPGSREPIGVDFASISELAVKLDSTPPSLYLFNRGQEPAPTVLLSAANGEILPDPLVQTISIFPDLAQSAGCNYMEFMRPGDEEYRRSIFVTA